MLWKQWHILTQGNIMFRSYITLNDHSDCCLEGTEGLSRSGTRGLFRKWLHWSSWEGTWVWNQDFSSKSWREGGRSEDSLLASQLCGNEAHLLCCQQDDKKWKSRCVHTPQSFTSAPWQAVISLLIEGFLSKCSSGTSQERPSLGAVGFFGLQLRQQFHCVRTSHE